jgi:hypothetical protein
MNIHVSAIYLNCTSYSSNYLCVFNLFVDCRSIYVCNRFDYYVCISVICLFTAKDMCVINLFILCVLVCCVNECFVRTGKNLAVRYFGNIMVEERHRIVRP